MEVLRRMDSTSWSAHALVSSVRDTALVLLVRDTIPVSRLVVDDIMCSNRLEEFVHNLTVRVL